MERINFALFVLLTLFSCQPQREVLKEGKPYESFRGFEPTDPTEYDDKVQILVKGKIVDKDIKILSTEEILSFLNNETVVVSVGRVSTDGSISYLPVTISAKATSYKVTMDYMKFATLPVRDSVGEKVVGFRRVGVGLRLISLITTLDAGINIGDLSSIGLAAKQGRLSGTLMIEVVGIKSKDVTTLLPLPSEINQTTIQNAMQSLATIKSKIYDPITELCPQVMAVKNELLTPSYTRKNVDVEKMKTDSIINDHKIKIQLGYSRKDQAESLENQAFDFLINKDIESALNKFEECEKVYPTYKSVSEIVKFLKGERQNLTDKDSTRWNTVYKTILDKYTWKMSPDVFAALTKRAQ